MPAGYYRYPTIHNDTLIFTCEDDLWRVPAAGGIARRLTSSLGEAARPSLAPDGTQVAFVGRDEGQPEIYVMPADGGPARRLTFMGGTQCLTAGWTADGRILFASNAGQPFASLLHLYTLDPLTGADNPAWPQRLPFGPAQAITFGPGGAMVIGRNTGDPARWKRYRGGRVGQLWLDAHGDGDFQPLLELDGNMANPLWLAGRIYFLSDHEGIGNLYSCLPDGTGLCRHTDHHLWYARNAAGDGRRIIYHAGADLYLFDPASDQSSLIPIEMHSPQTQRNRKFVYAGGYLQEWTLHPQGHATAITSRGKLFTFANWEGAVRQQGNAQQGSVDNGRYRLPQWLNDGRHLLAVTDSHGEEQFVVLDSDAAPDQEPDYLPDLDIGRPLEIAVNPVANQIVFSNHRYELLFLDLETHELRLIDRGHADRIAGFDWSPDGRWLAYSVSISLHVTMLKLWHRESGQSYPLTRPVLRDVAPAFDPGGRYLYFISYRDFDPVYDNLHFDLSFPWGMRPYLITLQKETGSPFTLEAPRPLPPRPAQAENISQPETGAANNEESRNGKDKRPAANGEKVDDEVRIDLEGIEERLIAFPVNEGRYGRIVGISDGKVLYSYYPIQGALSQPPRTTAPAATGTLLLYTFSDQKEEVVVGGITDFNRSRDAGTLIYRARNELRVLKAGSKPDKEVGRAPGRRSGWLDLERVKVSVAPGSEWRQMFREAWRLQRDQFWSEDMSQVDWLAVHDRYLPLVDRVSSRAEFSDLMWEMQGELATSHCYELGGDYRPEPEYSQGHLAADFVYEANEEDDGGWRIRHIVRGDAWNQESDSPLNKPGVNVKVGDVVLAVNGRRLNHATPPAALLVNLAGEEVTLTLLDKGDETGEESENDGNRPTRTVTIKTLKSETGARYREWVEHNRRRVHEATNGRVGYVHIPDMGAGGYAEFHRAYLAEVDRLGLIIDVRFNGGGHVSSLILEKLARRRIGYDISRWGQAPTPYPPESVMGPMVALTNEHAGSDGDIFCHGFKMMGLGPLLGKRTWGGVIGYWSGNTLVDGAITTQPELSFWFEDVGWGVENYGTEPDCEVDNRPQDYARGLDAQLELAISEISRLLDAKPPQLPAFSERPSRALPKLPPR
jgi:tricorn protease